MLSYSQQQDEVRMTNHHMLSPNHLPPQLQQQQQQQQQHELAITLQHLQSQVPQCNVEMLSKMISVSGLQATTAVVRQQQQQQLRTSPLTMPDLNLQQARELLSRPEAQAILQGNINCFYFILRVNVCMV